MRQRAGISDEEKAAMLEARAGGATLKQIRERFKRGALTVRDICGDTERGDAENNEHDPQTALVLSEQPPKKRGRPPKKAPDELDYINQFLEASVSNALEEPLAAFVQAVRRRMPNAQIIIVDVVNVKAKAHVAQEVDLTIGGMKK